MAYEIETTIEDMVRAIRDTSCERSGDGSMMAEKQAREYALLALAAAAPHLEPCMTREGHLEFVRAMYNALMDYQLRARGLK